MNAEININSEVLMPTENSQASLKNFSKITRLYKCKQCKLDLHFTCFKKVPKKDLALKCKQCLIRNKGRLYCINCGKETRLGTQSNLLCAVCNNKFGLKQCRKCKRVLIKLLYFRLNVNKDYLSQCCDCVATSEDSHI